MVPKSVPPTRRPCHPRPRSQRCPRQSSAACQANGYRRHQTPQQPRGLADPARGSDRSTTSCAQERNLALIQRRCGELQRLPEVSLLKLQEVVKDLLRPATVRNHVDDRCSQRAQITDDGNAAHLPRVNVDSLERHTQTLRPRPVPHERCDSGSRRASISTTTSPKHRGRPASLGPVRQY